MLVVPSDLNYDVIRLHVDDWQPMTGYSVVSLKASRSGNSKLMYYVTFGGIVMATTTHIRWYVIAKPVDPSQVLVSRGKLIRVGTNKKRGLVLIVINV